MNNNISFTTIRTLANVHRTGTKDIPVFDWIFDADRNEWTSTDDDFVIEQQADGSWKVCGFSLTLTDCPDDGSAMFAMELWAHLRDLTLIG